MMQYAPLPDDEQRNRDIDTVVASSALHSQWTTEQIDRLLKGTFDIGQGCIWYDNENPIALATWGWLNDEQEQQLRNETNRFTSRDYIKRNDKQRFWVMNIIATDGEVAKYVRDLDRLFSSMGICEVHLRRQSYDGTTKRFGKFITMRGSKHERWRRRK